MELENANLNGGERNQVNVVEINNCIHNSNADYRQFRHYFLSLSPQAV